MKANWFGISVLLILAVLNGALWAVIDLYGLSNNCTLFSVVCGCIIGYLVQTRIGIFKELQRKF